MRQYYHAMVQNLSLENILNKWQDIAIGMDNVPSQILVAYTLKLYNDEWRANMLQCHSWRESMIKMVIRMSHLEKYFS